MVNVIGVRFKKVGKVYYFDPQNLLFKIGDHAIVETSRGIECGEVTMANTELSDDEVVKPLKRVIRAATKTDLEVAAGNEEQARHAFEICKKKIQEHELDMHLVSVECTFDLNKILFYFTADTRVDFRDLVKDLASIFRTRIELRQIGVRDEAKMIGGLGICGRELCCASYMNDFQPVSINMAKEQNLSLNPTKISGTCGRLMCCLKYESDGYHEIQKNTPKNESLVETPEGRGTIVSTQMLRGTCKVQLEDSNDPPKTFCCGDCVVLRSGRAKCPRQQPPAAEVSDKQENPQSNEKSGDKERENRSSRPRREHRAHTNTDAADQSQQNTAAKNPAGEASAAADGEAKPKRRRRGGARRNRNKKPTAEGANTAPAAQAPAAPQED